MKSGYIRRLWEEYYAQGWNASLLVVDAMAMGIIALDCFRFASAGWEIGTVYQIVMDDFSVKSSLDLHVLLFWVLIIPFAIAASRTSLHKAHAQSKKPHRMQRKWEARIRKSLRFKSAWIVVSHLVLGLVVAHCAAIGITMQRLSGRFGPEDGWGFQSYWASLVSLAGLFYATVLVPAVQIAVVKILGLRIGMPGHGFTAEASTELPIAASHSHLSAHG